MININNIYKSFGEKIILSDLSLEIKDDELFGLVGINGAGKSTLLRIIAGVYEADKGQVLIDNENVNEKPLLKKNLFFLSDDLYYPFNSKYKNVLEFYKTFYDFSENRFNAIIQELKLDLSRNISNFSKGMKRQLFIAIALSLKVKYLFLDEAFDGLDPLARLIFKKYLYKSKEENKLTAIISSHDLKELEGICSNYGILDDGKIASSGDIKDGKQLINKYQLYFEKDVTRDDFLDLNIIDYHKNGKIIEIVVKGNDQENIKKLKKMDPKFIEKLDLNFEEFFVFEAKERGYINDK